MSESEKKIIKVGVIGAGEIANVHLMSLSLIENNRKIWGKNRRVKVVAAADPSEEKLEEKRRNFGIKNLYTDPYKIIEDEEISAVYVLTPTVFHKEYTVAAADNGKHVFIEKPLAFTLQDIDEMIAARDRNGVKMQVGLVFRSAPLVEYLRKFIADNSEKLGKLLTIILRDSQWKPYIGHKEAHGGSTWRKDRKLAHRGVLFEHGIHDIDVMTYLFGMPEKIYCKVKYVAGYEDIEDSVSAIIDLPDNVQFNITENWHNIHHDQRRYEIYFENAYFFMTIDTEAHVYYKYLGEPEVEIEAADAEKYFKDLIGMPHLPTEVTGPYYYESVRFFDAIFNDKPAYPSLEIGRRAHEIVEKCYESARLGHPLSVDFGTDE